MDSTTRLHPLLTAAAVSVIVLSAAGVAAITGILPTSVGSTRTAEPLSVATAPVAAPVAAAAATPSPAAAPATAQTPPAKPRAVKKSASRSTTDAREREYEREVERGLERDRGPLAQAQTQAPIVQAQAPAARPVCRECGTVDSVREIEEKGKGSWIGPVAGGVGGAILGKQLGKGTGNTIMTVLGAAGGAFAGNEIEKRARATKRWEVSVRLDDGAVQTVSYDTAPAWRAGERVRVANGTLTAEPRALN